MSFFLLHEDFVLFRTGKKSNNVQVVRYNNISDIFPHKYNVLLTFDIPKDLSSTSQEARPFFQLVQQQVSSPGQQMQSLQQPKLLK